METKATVNGKRLFIHQLSKHLSTSDPPVTTTNPDVPATATPATAAFTSAPAPASTKPPANNASSQKEVASKTRIVVVRAKSSMKNENGEEVEVNDVEQANSVDLPPLLTDGVSYSRLPSLFAWWYIILANVGVSHPTTYSTVRAN